MKEKIFMANEIWKELNLLTKLQLLVTLKKGAWESLMRKVNIELVIPTKPLISIEEFREEYEIGRKE